MMAYLAYVRTQQAWVARLITPQVIHDEALMDYVIQQKHIVIVTKHPLTEKEAQLPIDVLVKCYPPPEEEEESKDASLDRNSHEDKG